MSAFSCVSGISRRFRENLSVFLRFRENLDALGKSWVFSLRFREKFSVFGKSSAFSLRFLENFSVFRPISLFSDAISSLSIFINFLWVFSRRTWSCEFNSFLRVGPIRSTNPFNQSVKSKNRVGPRFFQIILRVGPRCFQNYLRVGPTISTDFSMPRSAISPDFSSRGFAISPDFSSPRGSA